MTFTLEYHQQEALHHATEAEQALANLLEDPAPINERSRRESRANQAIGVHLKLADIHARLAVAVAGGKTATSPFPPGTTRPVPDFMDTVPARPVAQPLEDAEAPA